NLGSWGMLANQYSSSPANLYVCPRSKDSMYHALGYSTILVMQAAMTFEHQDIQMGISTMKEALHTCQRFRKRSTVVESLSSLVSKQSMDQLSEEEMHAEICYAECLLQKAALTFVQDENMINFIKGGLKIRTSYQIYKFVYLIKLSFFPLCLILQMLSLLPGRILRLLEFIGFSGNRNLGLHQLREGASGTSLRAILCTFTLLLYHTYVSLILGKNWNIEAETLLEPYLQKFPNGSIILFYDARIDILKGNFEKAQSKFQECIAAQQEWKQIHHLCYWELMWCYSFQQNWLQAYRYADLLCKESRWSKAIYVFQKAAILCMLPDEDVKTTGEDIVSLFRQVEGLRQRIAGKSIPTEKLAVRKARRYTGAQPVKLILPALEMMYVWNGFTIVGKRADLTESLLITIEKEETTLKNQTIYSYNICLLYLTNFISLCFVSEKQIKYDNYLVPFTLYELGLLYKQQDQREKAIRYIETANREVERRSSQSTVHSLSLYAGGSTCPLIFLLKS
uniref:Tetratricopeptide repeat protein 39B n=1 Tax=Chelydra serpentina TaxID=8475 RepID=A0A8C3TI81_CHESE